MPRRKQNCPKRLKSSDEDNSMKQKSNDSVEGDGDKDLDDEQDSNSQSSQPDNESDFGSPPEQPSPQAKGQVKVESKILTPPPPPPPPPVCTPTKGSPLRDMTPPSPLRRSSVITDNSLSGQSSVTLPPHTATATIPVSVITRTISHSSHNLTTSRHSVRDQYKPINGLYRSLGSSVSHSSNNSTTSGSHHTSHHRSNNAHSHIINNTANSSSNTMTSNTTPSRTTNHHMTASSSSNSDEPLDLSKKTKTKTHTSPLPVSNGISGGLSSSLKSLQQRFGGDFHINGTNIRVNKSIEDPVVISQLPVNHFSTSHLISSNLSDYSNNVNTDVGSSLKVNSNNSLMSQMVETPSDSCTEGGSGSSRYTTHRCSCQKVFSTLYDLSIHLQETHHIPPGSKDASLMEYPKLVRGQDMWLNQESEQTRRILRCMQCGESFKTLPELTLHMMQTQHYTKIVSSDHGRRSHKCSSYCDRDLEKECIFKCKVCQETYNDMEGLANHMIMSGHHKKQILRSYNSPEILLRARRKRPFSSEDKLGLGANPTVATLLEFKRKCVSHESLNSPNVKFTDIVAKDEDGYITCENCGKCIEMQVFVEHIRTCVRQRSGVIDALKMKLNADDDQRRQQKKVETPNANTGSNISNPVRKTSPNRPTVPDSTDYDITKVKTEPKEVDERCDSLKEVPVCSPSKLEPKTEIMDSSTPEEKVNNLKVILPRVSEEDSNGNSSNNNTTNIRKETDKVHLDIIDPGCSDTGGLSALRAMESFIQKSFKTKFDKSSSHKEVSNNTSSSSSSTTAVTQEIKRVTTPESPSSRYIQIPSQQKPSLRSSSYFPTVPSSQPALCQETNDEGGSEQESNESFKTAGKELQSLSDMCEQITKQVNTPSVKSEEKILSSSSDINKEENSKSPTASAEKKPCKEALEEKYLQLPPTTEPSSSHSSALDSLSSFVYGQPMTCEHPLDSLQKLITNTDSMKLPSNDSHPSKCQTVIPSSSPEIAIPLNLSTKCQKDEDKEKVSDREESSVLDNSTDAGHGDLTSPASDSDSGDYKCPACSRQCASKGSCRYHLSRCHLSSVKKFSIRDPFSMSPFVYLPLDHTAKFTKYYEMAHELANKGSVSHELTAKGK
ncbi:teashirt homolog 1-like isoform X1 [Octopus sinensis]|uniref:Teashirt homolog 1-like isoform X1 n=2 Tax=Octopus sinensis TaxID=2607531 RepID=A0A6P7SIJ2_9MOLL|nr:teashirt homolog 1-like isoform X1 [Octopus sinensis]